MLRVGLTGGIGSGKSTVLQMLAARGAAVVDADAISRNVTARGGAAIAAIAQRFGTDFIGGDGGLDRVRMREHAYSDKRARKQLEEIIHPLVSQQSALEAKAAQAAGRQCLVFDIPLLVESGRWRNQVDHVLVVDCSPETQAARVIARGLTRDEASAIIASQAVRLLRLGAADSVICNDGLSIDQLESEVAQAAHSFGL
jgi:dephospho-CoA kinase